MFFKLEERTTVDEIISWDHLRMSLSLCCRYTSWLATALPTLFDEARNATQASLRPWQ
jgi:hypothetical protein